MIRDDIEKGLRTALDLIGVAAPSEITLEHPAELQNGDFATGVSLALAKQTGKNPQALAAEIVAAFSKNIAIEKIEVAGPGFINFHLAQQFFSETNGSILKDKEEWGRNKLHSEKRVTVEYTDPNPFKPFHIGHLMTNVIGESIARLYAANGANVTRANYQGDVGLHVAKAIWGMREKGSDPKDIHAIGEAYAYGADKYETDQNAKQEIDALNKVIYERSDAAINELYDIGRQTSLDRFEEIYKMLGTDFDQYFFESETADIGKQIVEEGLEKGIFVESDGAVVYRGEDDGLHTRVFLNSQGLPTYEAKELGLAKVKYERTKYDLSFVVTANEIAEYFKVLLSAMRKLFPELAEKTIHVTHGFMRLSSGKMSSRKGNIITGESLIEDMKAAAMEKMEGRELSNKEEVAEMVGVAAIKYSILRQTASRDIVFDPEKSLSFEGDSGPYLQYAHTRALSVLEKAEKEGIEPSLEIAPEKISELERYLYRFPEVVERATDAHEPHHVTTYLTELAGAFNSWYANEQIVNTDDVTSPYKLALTKAFQITMQNGLQLLGIKTPQKM
jgi:arginyl-tRNA synthetase